MGPAFHTYSPSGVLNPKPTPCSSVQGDADDREKLREKAKQDRRERERQTLMDDMEGEILKQHGMVRVLI